MFQILNDDVPLDDGFPENQNEPAVVPLPNNLLLFNGGQQCDALKGPCACGATHAFEHLKERLENQRVPDDFRKTLTTKPQ